MALVGALICRKVPPTKTEKVSRRYLQYPFPEIMSSYILGYEKTIGRDEGGE